MIPTMTVDGAKVRVFAFDFEDGKRCPGATIDLTAFAGQRVRFFMDENGTIAPWAGVVGSYFTILGEIDVPPQEHKPDEEDPEKMVAIPLPLTADMITKYDKPS